MNEPLSQLQEMLSQLHTTTDFMGPLPFFSKKISEYFQNLEKRLQNLENKNGRECTSKGIGSGVA